MSFTDDLCTGVAAYLHGLGVVEYSADPTVDVSTMTWPLIIGSLGPKPANAVGMRPYGLQPDPSQSDVVQPIQFWIRGVDLVAVNGKADDLFDALHGVERLTLGGIPVWLTMQNSSVPQGIDTEGHEQRAENYYLSATRPTASRPN